MPTGLPGKTTIPLSEPFFGEEEKLWALKCLESGYVSTVGPMVTEFEKRFAEYAGAAYAVATASGTAAIHVALHALGIGEDAHVIVPDLTFVASMNPVLYCHATPQLVDIDRNTWCLSPSVVDAACRELLNAGRKPSAIIPVHLYGCACDMDGLMEVAKKYGLLIVEDATEALGTRLRGKQVGTIGDAGCFSFNGNKLITTGSGGMVTTNSAATAEKVRYLVNQARDASDSYVHSRMGFNYRMSSLSASMGIAQLGKIQRILERKQLFAAKYRAALAGIPSVTLHPESAEVDGSYWLYSITMNDPEKRDSIISLLAADGIQARRFFTPLHRQPYVRSRIWTCNSGEASLSQRGNSDLISDSGINLPSSAGMTDGEQDYVISRLKKHLTA